MITRERSEMPVLDIVTYPNPILRKKSPPVEAINDEIQSLIDDMIITMHAASGIGLAAPQVGISIRIMVVDINGGTDPGPIITLINPEIISSEGENIREEGCLSVPGFCEELTRANKVKIKGMDRVGKEIVLEGEGLLARAFHHEMDHLNGLLFFDRLNKVKKELLKLKIKRTLKKEIIKTSSSG
jgi:peptide deformylase